MERPRRSERGCEMTEVYTAADLARAWEAGRDAAANARSSSEYVKRITGEQYFELKNYDKGYINGHAAFLQAIRDMTPPADLAELLKGGAK